MRGWQRRGGSWSRPLWTFWWSHTASVSSSQSIVLTREGYRSLLHLNPAYSNFLKTVMAGSTLLYMGFSFTDGYFNEIRSELMTLQVVARGLEHQK